MRPEPPAGAAHGRPRVSPAEFAAQLHRAGVTLSVEHDGALVARPADRLTTADLAVLAAHHAAIVAAVQGGEPRR